MNGGDGACVWNIIYSFPSFSSTAAALGDMERLEENSIHQLNTLSAVNECNKTFALDDGQAALLYSRSDLYR